MAPSKASAPKSVTNGVPPGAAPTSAEPAINSKRQKKRQKQAARLAASQSAPQSGSDARPLPSAVPNGIAPHAPATASNASGPQAIAPSPAEYGSNEYDEAYEARNGDDRFYSEEDARLDAAGPSATGKSKKKKKSKNNRSDSQYYADPDVGYHDMDGSYRPPPPPPPPLQSAPLVSRANSNGMSKDRIWNTSTAEERERIKEFWLSLAEKERRSLVKVEKETVLKKMKEQQKHSCSCSVCGRKRHAIEEELEMLYDAYYDELEDFAYQQHLAAQNASAAGMLPPPPSAYSALSRMPPRHAYKASDHPPPSSTRMAGTFVEDEEEEPSYSEEELSSEEYYETGHAPHPAAEFFEFGKNLTVDSGILTVADDLLQNEGKKFIEMMEQLAERRMQREEEAQYAAAGLRHPSSTMPGHTHDAPPLDDAEYDEDDPDEDYASDEEDDDEYDDAEMVSTAPTSLPSAGIRRLTREQETMTEEQRMEEGRRMFQIFAARMFEQRVLTAYREKVARERQEKLLEELADESRLDAEREAKKAKEAQKKKEKKKKQQAVKEEERLKRESEKAAEEAATREAEERRLEEQRQKKDEQRRKREAEKKAQDEEKARKEAEKQRRLQEAREQQAESERKQREQKEREKRRKDEAKRKEREEREAREKEKRDSELAEKREREAKAKADREARERARKEELARKEEQAKQAAQEAPIPPKKPTVPAPPGLGPLPAAHLSPHPQVATPIIPKAPTPRARQQSRQSSQPSSPKSTHLPTTGATESPAKMAPPPIPVANLPGLPRGVQPLSLAQAQVLSPTTGPPPGIYPDPGSGMTNSPDVSTPGFSPHHGPMGPGAAPRGPNAHDNLIYSQQPFSAPPNRIYHNQNPLAFPPGITGMRPPHQGPGSPVGGPVTQAPIGSGVSGAPGPIGGTGHSRQTSLESAQPFSRMNTIPRPLSNPQHDDLKAPTDENERLGSSALLDDADETLGAKTADPRAPLAPVGQRPARLGFGGSPVFSEAPGSARMENFRGWGGPSPMPFGPANAPPHSAGWAPGQGALRPNLSTQAGRQLPKPVQLRLLVCEACRRLNQTDSHLAHGRGQGYHSAETLLQMVAQLRGPLAAGESSTSFQQLKDICDTEGNAQNGGGTFIINEDPNNGCFIRHVPEPMPPGRGMGLGDIGSPVAGPAVPFGAGRAFGRPGGGIPQQGF